MSTSNIKQNIKSSALELFNTVGYEATSIRDLSAKANCSLPMMYYYYESKEKLLWEIVSVDFVELINGIFAKALKTKNLRLFAISFVNDIINMTPEEKNIARIALRLHMGSPRIDALNKVVLQYKFSKELELKNFLLSVWRMDKNLEGKTHLVLSTLYNAMISVLLTNRQISVKQIENDIIFLL